MSILCVQMSYNFCIVLSSLWEGLGGVGPVHLLSYVCPVAPGFGCVDLGHVISFARSVLQWGRMCSYRYHYRFKSRPGTVVLSGMVVFNVTEGIPFLRIVNCISGPSENSHDKDNTRIVYTCTKTLILRNINRFVALARTLKQ